MQGVQLQAITFQLKQINLQRDQLQTNHIIESSATNKLPCREIGYKQINLQRDQLHTNQLVQRSATNKSSRREIS